MVMEAAWPPPPGIWKVGQREVSDWRVSSAREQALIPMRHGEQGDRRLKHKMDAVSPPPHTTTGPRLGTRGGEGRDAALGDSRVVPQYGRDNGYRVKAGRILNRLGSEPETMYFFGEVSPQHGRTAISTPNPAHTGAPHPSHRYIKTLLDQKPNVSPHRGPATVRAHQKADAPRVLDMLQECIKGMLRRASLLLEDAMGRSYSGQLHESEALAVMGAAGLAVATPDVAGLQAAYGRGGGGSLDARRLSGDLRQLAERPQGCYQAMPALVTAVARRLKHLGETLALHLERRDLEARASYEERLGMQGTPSGYVDRETFARELGGWGMSLGGEGAYDLLQVYDTDGGAYAGCVCYAAFVTDLAGACTALFDAPQGLRFAKLPASEAMYPRQGASLRSRAARQSQALSLEGLPSGRDAAPSSILSPKGGRRDSAVRSVAFSQQHGGRPGSGTTMGGVGSSRRSSTRPGSAMSGRSLPDDSDWEDGLRRRLKGIVANVGLVDLTLKSADHRRTGTVGRGEFEEALVQFGGQLSAVDLNWLTLHFEVQNHGRASMEGRIGYEGFFDWLDLPTVIERTNSGFGIKATITGTGAKPPPKPLVQTKKLRIPKRPASPVM